ncbi:hypothetical protein B0J14DRAFT_163863 [Halenospora varia]|nr:hypothetical protein B0J14DRAFT_163863 [Halenospora varia]
MTALESREFVRFAPPLSSASFCNRNNLCPAKPSRAIRSPTSSQKARRPAATPSRSGCQAKADRNMATSEDDDLPSLEELSRTAPRPKISTEASKTESTAQRQEQPALDGAGLQVDRTQPGLGGRQGDSRDQPMILDDDYPDEAEEGTSGDVDTRCIGRDASPHNTLATSELASKATSPLIHPVHSMTLRRAAILRSELRDLGLVSSKACILLPHKLRPRPSPNPLRRYKIRPTSNMSAVLLGARQWSLRSTPSPSLSTVAIMDGLMIAWLNWRQNWGWL